MIAVLHLSPTTAKAVAAARAEAVKALQPLATTHGLGTVKDWYLSEVPLASRDARGQHMRSLCRALGTRLNDERPSVLLVSGTDLIRHALAATRKYRTSAVTPLVGYSAEDRFVAVQQPWRTKCEGMYFLADDDAPDTKTYIVPSVSLDVWSKESHRGRELPIGYWSDLMTGLIELAKNKVHHRHRLSYARDGRLLNRIERAIEDKIGADPLKAFARENLGL